MKALCGGEKVVASFLFTLGTVKSSQCFLRMTAFGLGQPLPRHFLFLTPLVTLPSALVFHLLLLQAVALHGLSVTWLFINSPCPSLSDCLDTQETGYQETEAGKTHRAGVEGSSQPGLSFRGSLLAILKNSHVL